MASNILPMGLIENDGRQILGVNFEQWRVELTTDGFQRTVTPATNDIVAQLKVGTYKPFSEVFIKETTLNKILRAPNCEGILFYQALVEVTLPNGVVEKVTTLAAVGVDPNGALIHDNPEGPFYIDRPCPPYCPPWM
jgi:hypothetical protein